MRVFLSSVIAGFEEYRDAASSAISRLGHDVIRAEDFGASSSSPQETCLRGVREADIVILILGERYGHIQASGRSATHEEYLEARERHPLLAFIQADIVRDSNQEALVHEVEDWKAGYYTTRFTTPNHLHDIVLRALHEHEVSTALGPVDTDEVQTRSRPNRRQT